MNNFGVVEVASTKTTHAPGWAYVPDTGINPAVAALQPTNRKRAARNLGGRPNATDVSARQDAKIRKELEVLDRDGHRDANIPIPAKPAGRAQTKHTPNVRKILLSQKTFANHLDDYQAFQALAESNSSAAAAAAAAATLPPPTAPSTSKRSAPAPKTTPAAKAAAAAAKAAPATTASATDDTPMPDAPSDTTPPLPTSYPPDGTILPAYDHPPPAPHPGDSDPLLASRVPPFPTDAELRALVAAPPLGWADARGAWWPPEEGGYPPRRFCEVCGYWGRVRCAKCGARVCALDCLEVHREECFTRYGI